MQHENKSYYMHSHLSVPYEISKKDFLYDEKSSQYHMKSKLLLNFIENLPQKEKMGLKHSLVELRYLRNKDL